MRGRIRNLIESIFQKFEILERDWDHIFFENVEIIPHFRRPLIC